MGRRHLLYLLYTSSVRPPSAGAFFYPPPPPPPTYLIRKGYSHESTQANHANETMNHERAASTLEEFKRLEEEKSSQGKLVEEKASQGVASQTAEKAQDGLSEAVTNNDDDLESVKESFKEPVGAGNFRRTGDE